MCFLQINLTESQAASHTEIKKLVGKEDGEWGPASSRRFRNMCARAAEEQRDVHDWLLNHIIKHEKHKR